MQDSAGKERDFMAFGHNSVHSVVECVHSFCLAVLSGILFTSRAAAESNGGVSALLGRLATFR